MFETLQKFIEPEGLAYVCAVGFVIQTICAFIVNISKTPAETSLFGKIYMLIEKIAGLWGPKAKDVGKTLISLDIKRKK